MRVLSKAELELVAGGSWRSDDFGYDCYGGVGGYDPGGGGGGSALEVEEVRSTAHRLSSGIWDYSYLFDTGYTGDNGGGGGGGDSGPYIPPGYSPVGDGSKYMQDANGQYHLTPEYADQVAKVHIDWQGVFVDLAAIAGASLGGVTTGITSQLGNIIGYGAEAWKQMQDYANSNKDQ